MGKVEFKRKGARFTIEELNEKYGFEAPTYEQYSKGETIHPTYKKWLEMTWIIENIYGHVEAENMSLGKARELTSAVVEEFVSGKHIDDENNDSAQEPSKIATPDTFFKRWLKASKEEPASAIVINGGLLIGIYYLIKFIIQSI